MNKIISIIKKKKTIPLDEYINLSLYDKKIGYYMKKNPFGKKGDFITSPLVTNLFAEMIAIWCVAFWEHLKKPKKILIVELGPGDGSLCKDLIKIFKKFNSFNRALEINLLEVSKKLKTIQKSKIVDNKIKWIKKIEDINSGPIVFIGNEFFDSLPIKQLIKKKKIFFEKHIGLTNNNKSLKFIYKKANNNLIKSIKKLNIISKGSVIEYPIDSIKYLISISKKINKFNGALLTFDYGYKEKMNYDSLQSIKKHKYSNSLVNPGNIDITSHINFRLFNEILKKNNLSVKKIVTQNKFLRTMGIVERANILSKKMTFKQKADMFFRLKRLLDFNEMGNLFKVLLAQKKNGKFSLGF